MKITVITVTYNSEDFIENCIQSVINQSYSDVEYVIIDGASTDLTMHIVNKYKEKVNYILSESDNGIYDAINKGILCSTGDVIGILNSDDFFTFDGALQRIAYEFENDKELKLLFADIAIVDRDTATKIARYYSSKMFRPWMFRFGFQPAHPTCYIKRDVFENFGMYRTDMKIAADFELLARFLSKHKIRFKYLSKQLVSMRNGGVSNSGFKSVLLLNSEIIRALRVNSVYTNIVFVYSKYFFKWWGYIFK